MQQNQWIDVASDFVGWNVRCCSATNSSYTKHDKIIGFRTLSLFSSYSSYYCHHFCSLSTVCGHLNKNTHRLHFYHPSRGCLALYLRHIHLWLASCCCLHNADAIPNPLLSTRSLWSALFISDVRHDKQTQGRGGKPLPITMVIHPYIPGCMHGQTVQVL